MSYFLIWYTSVLTMFFRFFFFKQKTAYEMRISDWSSDVCSSDLPVADRAADVQPRVGIIGVASEAQRMIGPGHDEIVGVETEDELARFALALALHLDRAEGRVLDRDRQLFGRGDEDMAAIGFRSEEHTSELQSLMRISYAVFCLKKKTTHNNIYD